MWTCSSVHLGACHLLLSRACVCVCDNIVATFRRVGGRGATIGDGMGATMAGFDDSLQRRNRALLAGGAAKQPSAKKTGTTIAGVVYKVPFQRTSEKCGNWFGGGALLLPAAPRSRLECPSGRVLSPLLQLKKRWSAFVFSFRFFLSVFLCFQSVTDSGSRSMLPASLCVIVCVCVCCCAGRGCSRRGYAVDERGHSGRQKLREDPLHQRQHLLLRRWHCSRH